VRPQTQTLDAPSRNAITAVDADSHIDENDETWSYMAENEQRYRPVQITQPFDKDFTLWVFDGTTRRRQVRDDIATRTTVETRELMDVDARLRDMDRMGVQTQIIYPSFFIPGITDRPQVELALRRSYNRWLAERCAKSGGRLRWVMLPPWMSIDKAVEEVRWAKDHGAVAVLKKGDCEAGHWPSEEYNFPVYAEAEKLDMAITFHVGTGEVDETRRVPIGAAYGGGGVPIQHAFRSLVFRAVPGRFPKLRWGFVEAGASWVPGVLYNLRHITDTIQNRPNVQPLIASSSAQLDTSGNILARNNLYVSCQTDEDLPYILRQCGEDNLMIGSDYTHNDSSQQMDFRAGLQCRVNDGDISQSAAQKIMVDNPRRFYGV
jgi:predicted TIM-barrel fold metal-dependent hydrolase